MVLVAQVRAASAEGLLALRSGLLAMRPVALWVRVILVLCAAEHLALMLGAWFARTLRNKDVCTARDAVGCTLGACYFGAVSSGASRVDAVCLFCRYPT